jgi:3-oxoacyl-[acyl-carrier-protein] synthase II
VPPRKGRASLSGTRRVVVTGLGVVSPLAGDVDGFWRSLAAGRSGVGEITRFDHAAQRVHIAAEVKDFDVLDYLDKRHARRLDRFTQYAVASALMAVEDAGYAPSSEPERCGAVIGGGVGGVETLERETQTLIDRGPDRISPLLIPMMISNMAAGQVSISLGIKGPTSAICTACAAGADAIGYAMRLIRGGAAEVMLAGGTEAPVTPLCVAGFAAARALSTRGGDPTAASRPFDAGRDGFVIGEGAACLVLEELAHARARGARIYAELAGVGMSADASHMTLPDESGLPQARAMRSALEDAGLAPGDIDYVNAHGTSTQAGDRAESRAIKEAFGDAAPDLAVSSIKSMTGHCFGASGALEAVATVLTIVNSLLPPTINLTEPDPECDLDYVPREARLRRVDAALSNSFAFGGHNVALVLRRCDG